MTMTSHEAGSRILDRSSNPWVGESDRRDAFSEGAGMLLKAIVDELDTPVSAAWAGRDAVVRACGRTTAEPDGLSLRAYLEAAAARFEGSLGSTVVCIKPTGRSYGLEPRGTKTIEGGA